MTIKLIIGLRNPGGSYQATRHNVGEWLVTQLASRYNLSFKADKKLMGELTELQLPSLQCKLLLPLTFMNLCGQPAKLCSHFYRFLPNEILIVHDELDLPTGKIKLKSGGGHGGHNGLRDVINQLGCADFYRLRIGIGHPGHRDLVHQYVLGKPPIIDKQLILDAIGRTLEYIPMLCHGDFAKAMNQINI